MNSKMHALLAATFAWAILTPIVTASTAAVDDATPPAPTSTPADAPVVAPAPVAASAQAPQAAAAPAPVPTVAASENVKNNTSRASAADASKVSSTGAYAPSELKVAQHAPYGAKFGKAEDFAAVPQAAHDSGVQFYVFGGAAAFALLVSAGAAFAFSRTTKPDGAPSRTLTIGTKLAGGFGSLVTGILVLAMFSSRSSSTVFNARAEAEHRSQQELLISAMDGDLCAVRLDVKNFLMSNGDAALAAFSDDAATLEHKLDLAKQTIVSPERVKMVESFDTNAEEYERLFAEVVGLIDERNAIVDGQMGGAAARVTELLNEIAVTAHADGDTEAALAGADASDAFQQARVSFFKYLRNGDEKFAQESLKLVEDAGRQIQRLESEIQNPKRRTWLKEATAAAGFWSSRMEQAQKLQHQRDELVKNRMDKIGPQMAQVSNDLIASLAKSKAEVAEQADQTAAAAKVTTVAVSGIIAFIGAFLALTVTRAVQRPIGAMIAQITAIRTSNDMTSRVDVKSRDEIGRLGESFNGMIATLHDIIAEVKSGAVQIDAGGAQIAAASQSLAQGGSEQASSLQQISASLEEISGQTQQSAENARQASTLAEENKKSADRGQQEMAQMSKAVNEIKQSSSEISKIIKVIDEIAFQTNLLALNAAVEAARAGEAGKGFAVVAEEVRNLAQRSAEAAKNTSSMIEESVKRSDNGVQIAVRVGQALEEITASTNKVNALLSEIASASSEQATGIGQINQGVSQLDQVTQQTAGNSEELASSAEEMSAQVASLNELVAQFKVNGASTASSTRSAGAHVGAKNAAPAQPVKSHAPASGRQDATAKKALLAAAKAAKNGAAAPNGKKADRTSVAEQVIPMENDEVLASF